MVEKIEAIKPLPTRLKVAAYCRISMITERTSKSLATQVSYYNQLITSTPGWEFAGVFSDDGISGTSTKKRAGYLAMMEQARAGKIDLILTKSISRLARNTVDLLNCVRELKALGVEVRFEKEKISTATADGEFLLTLLASFAQGESEQRSKDVSWAIQKRFKEGKTNGFHLFGYTSCSDAAQTQIIEEEAKVVRWIYESYLNKISCETMARILSKQGVRFMHQKTDEVNPGTLREILKQRAYTGDLLLGRTYCKTVGEGSRTVNTGERPMYLVEDAIPAIISKELFEAVQTERARRRSLGAKANWSIPTTAFTSKIYCPTCKKNYYSASYKRYGGKIQRGWICASKKVKNCTCTSKRIPEDVLKDIVCEACKVDEFKDELLDDIVRIEIVDIYQADVHFHDGHVSSHKIVYPTKRDKSCWDDPEFKRRHKEALAKFYNSMTEEERREYYRRRTEKTVLSDAERKARSERSKKMWTPERRARHSQLAKEMNAKVSPEERKRRAQKAAATMKKNPEIAKARSERMKKWWQDPAFREKVSKAASAAARNRRGNHG